MPHPRKPLRRFTWSCTAWLAALLAPGVARAQAPQVGETRKFTVITISMQVGSTEKESKQVTYAPPPGWYVRSHSVECTAKRGNSSYWVNTVPRDWAWLSEEQVRQSYKGLIEVAGKSHGPGAQAKFARERDSLLSGLRRARSTHHALVVEATARGEGLLRGRGCVELTVTAELVYLGTEDDLRRAAPRHRAKLE